MRVKPDGRIEYPTHRCTQCTVMSEYEPGQVCEVCVYYGAEPTPPKPYNPYEWLLDWGNYP